MLRDVPVYLNLVAVLTSPEIRPALRHDWRVIFKSFDNYLGRTFSRTHRLRIEANHYCFLRRRLDSPFLAQISKAPLILWESGPDAPGYRIVLGLPLSIYKEHNEGDLTLTFEADAQGLFALSFTICPGSIFGLQAEHIIYIGRSQGKAGTADAIKRATRSCLDVAPLTLLLASLQAIALDLKIHDLVAVGAENQVSIGWDTPEKFHSVYDQFWTSAGANTIGENVYHLPIPLPEKPLGQIKRNHRARVVRRRQFKRSVCDAVALAFREQCLAKTSAAG